MEKAYRNFFHLASAVTDLFPAAGGRALDLFLKKTLGSGILSRSLLELARRRTEKISRSGRFLVASDLNLGDAVICSSGVAALRRIFPLAEIDFVIKKSAADFFRGNNDISSLLPLYEGAPWPAAGDLEALSRISGRRRYDLVINFSPMIRDGVFFGRQNVINFAPMAAELMRNEMSPDSVNNISWRAYHFMPDLFCPPGGHADDFQGPRIYLPDEAVEEAGGFLKKSCVPDELPVIMFNPDTSSRFTRMPFEVQLDLLERLSAGLECTLLLGAGHAAPVIHQRLLLALRRKDIKSVIVVPAAMGIVSYAALIDFADIYITGDTGPLHLAAARKYSEEGEPLRNRTAVFSVFGATPPRIYGYDSRTPGFLAANQDAPSRAFAAPAPCRNITCINKLAKTCREVRCFDCLDTDRIVREAADHLENARRLRAEEGQLSVG